MPKMRDAPTAPALTDRPLYWFAALERAVEGGDHQAAADAQKELARLGVAVRYGRRSSAKEGDHAR